MANTNKKYSSINDQTAQAMRNNQNTLEILTKIDQSLHSSESHLTIKTVDATGKETSSQIPTLGYFQQRLDQLFKMVNVLSGVDGNPAALKIAENQFKRIVVADLNLEPKPIPAVSPVSIFKADPNWIFDAFLNPKISVEIDLTDKIADDCRTIQSKRFIVDFDKVITIDANGDETVVLSTNGAARKKEFEQKYKGKSNIDMVEFVTWLDTPGLVNRIDDTLIDQDYFRVEPNRLQFKGDFTITGTDTDTLNKKFWHILNTLTYYDISDPLNPPKPIQLKEGDLININPNIKGVKSTTVYRVLEISSITSEYRVRFEAVYGEEPIPVRLNAISIYSDRVKNRKVKISVSFDDYSVIFMRQIDDINNLVGLDWSPGVGFWTNELRLDNANGELFSEFYINKVYDYGLVLEDLVAKKVPNYYGIKPNAPILDSSNFKVVQINAHLTQTVEAEQIRDLHNNKNNLVSEIQQLHDAVEKQNRLIQTTSFNSTADKKRADDQLTLLNNKLQTKNQTKFSVVQDILSSKKNLNKIPPVYHLRGFFPMPEAVESSKTTPQEVVQFEIWYRKLSKSGAEVPILTIPDLNNSAAKKSNVASAASSAIATASPALNISKPKTINGAFSNWVKIKSDSRKRSQDTLTDDWYWNIEDVSDANTPNINQIDLAISPGEKIEIKIKSLSEVGWPETPVESDFSNTVTVEFPNDLNNVLNEDDFILKEAQADELKVNFERDLETRGLNLHLNSSIRDADLYYAHRAEAIASGFKDVNNKPINLYDQLQLMYAKINTLEETINKAKGVLEVYLVNAGNKTRLFNGNNLTYNINLEDYMTKTKIGDVAAPVDFTARTYKNEIININQFQLLIKNSAETAPLGILSYRGYGQPSGLTPSRFAYDGGNILGSTRGIQATWIQGDSTILRSNITSNITPVSPLIAPQAATQQNNQWIWLQIKDINGNYIYDSASGQPNNDFWNNTALTNGVSLIHNTLIDKTHNLGFLTAPVSPGNSYPSAATGIKKITDPLNWTANENPIGSLGTVVGSMGSTIHPVISGFNDIIDTSTSLTKYIKGGDTNSILVPIYIYTKVFTGTGVSAVGSPNTTFDDASLGDMPTFVGTPEIEKNGSGQLAFNNIDNSLGLIKSGDKILVRGIATTGATTANYQILTVLSATTTGTDVVQTSFNVSSMAAGPITDAGIVLVQVHKHYQNTSTDGPELHAYNVLGRVGTDTRYVTNYVDIVTAISSPKPIVHNKSLRFYLEDENSIRPFEFQLNWNITQYKAVKISNVGDLLAANVIN